MQELQRLTQVMAEDGPYVESRSDFNQALVSCTVNDNIRGALQYLVTTLHSETASKALGSSCLTRLYFSVLTCPQGSALQELARSDSKLSRVSAAMRFMEKNLGPKIAMEEMGARVGLSLSAFHRIFKEAIDASPLQYLKKIRP